MPRTKKKPIKRKQRGAKMTKSETKVLKHIVKEATTDNYHDLNVSLSNCGFLGSVNTLSTIPTGDSPSQRSGTGVSPLKIDINGYVQLVNTSADRAVIRVLLVQHLTDIPWNPAAFFRYSGSDETSYSMRNMNHTNEYRTMHDKTYTLARGGRETIPISIHKTSFPCNIQYDRVDTLGTSYKQGQLTFVVFSNRNTSPPQLSFHSRIRFAD